MHTMARFITDGFVDDSQPVPSDSDDDEDSDEDEEYQPTVFSGPCDVQ